MPFQAHCFAFGGFEIQMLETMAAASIAGVDIEKMDPWSRDSDFDILHVWGLEPAHAMNVHWARQMGKQVVMTALLPYLSVSNRLRAGVQAGVSRLLGREGTRSALLKNVNRLIVVNALQADAAVRLFAFPRERIAIIPHMVAPQFFTSLQKDDTESKGYVLCTGNICRRKNQLRLVHACRMAGLPLLLIGSVLTGEEAYAAEVREAISGGPSVRWIEGVAKESDELCRAYKNAAVCALVSFSETQPISLLEARAAGCPLLIADRAYARDPLYRDAVLVEPDVEASITAGLIRAVARGRRGGDPAWLKQCTREAVGQAYAEIYRGLVAAGAQ